MSDGGEMSAFRVGLASPGAPERRPEPRVAVGAGATLASRFRAPEGRPRPWTAGDEDAKTVSPVPAMDAPGADCCDVLGTLGWKLVPCWDVREAGATKVAPGAGGLMDGLAASRAALLRLKAIEEPAVRRAVTTPSAETVPPVEAGAASCGEYGLPVEEGSRVVVLGDGLSSVEENLVALSPLAA